MDLHPPIIIPVETVFGKSMKQSQATLHRFWDHHPSLPLQGYSASCANQATSSKLVKQ